MIYVINDHYHWSLAIINKYKNIFPLNIIIHIERILQKTNIILAEIVAYTLKKNPTQYYFNTGLERWFIIINKKDWC